jgi:hypothetical protein
VSQLKRNSSAPFWSRLKWLSQISGFLQLGHFVDESSDSIFLQLSEELWI